MNKGKQSKTKPLPSIDQVLKRAEKFLTDRKGDDTDLYQMWKKQLIALLNYAQGK